MLISHLWCSFFTGLKLLIKFIVFHIRSYRTWYILWGPANKNMLKKFFNFIRFFLMFLFKKFSTLKLLRNIKCLSKSDLIVHTRNLYFLNQFIIKRDSEICTYTYKYYIISQYLYLYIYIACLSVCLSLCIQ